VKIFSNKKIVATIIISIGIIISSFVISFLSGTEQLKINNNENNNLKIQNISPEIMNSQQIFDKCEYDMHCVVEMLSNDAREMNKTTALATFEELKSLYHKKQVNSRCHSIAHHLGEWVYGYTQNIDESLQYADPLSCGGGIYHGVFENYFSILNFEGKAPEQVKIEDLCKVIENGNYYSLDMAHCYHGIGHGLMVLYDNDVFSAVKRCEDFNLEFKQKSCANGVFMQNVLKFFETGDGDFDKDDILAPCNEMKSYFASNCYVWQGAYILKQSDFEVYSSFRECEKITQEFIKYCYYGIGAELESDAAGRMEFAWRFCQAGENSNFHKYCFRGMAMKTSMVYLDSGFKFCSLVPEDAKEECYEGLGYWIKLRHGNDEEREKECLKVENIKYFEICLSPKNEGITYL
jgi:hypothetical protein